MTTYLDHFILLRFLFFAFMSLLLLTNCSFSSRQPLCHEHESSALLQFRDSLIVNKSFCFFLHDVPKASSWSLERENGSSDCCSWDGVECDHYTGHVISLDLSTSCLYGSINSNSSLFRLLQLQRLNLAHNDFNSSQIPIGVGSLSRLTYLNLSHANFSGQIPSEISLLSRLSVLDLSFNFDLYTTLSLGSFVQNLIGLEKLDLNFVSISSPVLKSLANLSSLTNLNLRFCGLFGKFPSKIFQLPQLEEIDLSFNHNLTGQLPEFPPGNPLQLLDVCYCNFSGSIPNSLSNHTKLLHLDLSGNFFNDIFSPVLENLANLSSLTYLGLNNCGLYGKFPSKIFQLPQLEFITLGGNQNLTGQLPEFPSGSPLKVLDVSYCNFSGSIPNLLSNLTMLLFLDLSGTLLTDVSWLNRVHSNDTLSMIEYLILDSLSIRKFPNILLNHNKLVGLRLSGNNLRGLIPRWMYNVSKEALLFLDLSDNFLTGFKHSPLVLPWNNLKDLYLDNNMLQGLFPVPPPSIRILFISNNFISGFQQPLEMLQRSNLEYFMADNNRLQGLLPIPPPSIRYYQVRYNTLTGAIPPIFCNLNSLLVLDLSNNKLSGMLHPCLGNLSDSLLVLGLRSNNFDSSIPNTWPEDCKLQMIDLSQNKLQGQMPRSLANCGDLEYLNVGNNRINDTFPFWLKNLYQLKIFILHFNGFHGAASNVESSDSMHELHILDISNNNFSGNLPVSNLLQSNAMKIVGANQLQYMGSRVDYSVTITNKGIELEYKKIKDDLTVIDFSCNRFKGKIPKLLGNLKGLRMLNLSNNALTGPIPLSLGNLTQLESLDLSWNMLFGEIPGQLVQLIWLEVFNVSYNHLMGPIPHGNQFDVFENTSFEGNPELCGRPLSKMCENSEYSPIPPSTFGKNQSSESLFIFGWKIVVIGYGCGFVIGVIIGQHVTARHPNWFIKTFGKKQQL